MIGYIVADEVPKPKDREHGAWLRLPEYAPTGRSIEADLLDRENFFQ